MIIYFIYLISHHNHHSSIAKSWYVSFGGDIILCMICGEANVPAGRAVQPLSLALVVWAYMRVS